jgi:histone H3/H4
MVRTAANARLQNESSSQDEESSRRANRSSQRGGTTSPQRPNTKQAQARGRNASQGPSTSRPANPPKGAAKRKGTAPVLRDIRQLQTHTENLIPKMCFCRLIREIMNRHGNFRITPEAIEALRESSETYTTNVLGDAYLITLNRKQVTLQPRDVHLLLLLRGEGR